MLQSAAKLQSENPGSVESFEMMDPAVATEDPHNLLTDKDMQAKVGKAVRRCSHCTNAPVVFTQVPEIARTILQATCHVCRVCKNCTPSIGCRLAPDPVRAPEVPSSPWREHMQFPWLVSILLGTGAEPCSMTSTCVLLAYSSQLAVNSAMA